MGKRTLLSWSSGKDSAWSLHILLHQPDIEIVGLFSTVNKKFERVAMHAVRTELLYQQAISLDLPIEIIPIPYPCSNVQYEAAMNGFIKKAKQSKIECFAFGDLFLKDVRKYREDNLAGTGITPIFPIWGKNTTILSKEMIDNGLKSIITCVNPKQLSPDFAGKEYDGSFLEQIPENVDPCGERGEFHSFVYGGPMFKNEIKIQIGETISRDGFVFTDILSKNN
jgi:uncharacterized protein (TIGR00290 family)